MDHSAHSSPSTPSTTPGNGNGASPAGDGARKRPAPEQASPRDAKRAMLDRVLRGAGDGATAKDLIDTELLRSLLGTFGVSPEQQTALVSDAVFRADLTDLCRLALKSTHGEGHEGTPGGWCLDLNAPELLHAWAPLCALYQRLLVCRVDGAATAMLMAARALRHLPVSSRRSDLVTELFAACASQMQNPGFVKGRAEVAEAYSLCLELLPVQAGSADGAQGPSQPLGWQLDDPMGNGTHMAPVSASGEWRIRPEGYALALLEAMFKAAGVNLALDRGGADWTPQACQATVDRYIARQLPDEVHRTDLRALERLLRVEVVAQVVPFYRYLAWHDVLRGLRARLGRQDEGAVQPAQLALWVRTLAMHGRVNQIGALVERYIHRPVVSVADGPYRRRALNWVQRLLDELEPGQLGEMPELIERLLAALDLWDMKQPNQKAQLLVRAAKFLGESGEQARQTGLLNKALGYVVPEQCPASPAEKDLLATLVPDLMALPAPVRLDWLERYFSSLGARLPVLPSVFQASPQNPIPSADVGLALAWIANPAVPVLSVFSAGMAPAPGGTGPTLQLRPGESAANERLQFQIVCAVFEQLMRYAPPDQDDPVAAQFVAWGAAYLGRPYQQGAVLHGMRALVDRLGRSFQRMPAAVVAARLQAIARQFERLAAGDDARSLGTFIRGRWLLESLNAYQVAVGREPVVVRHARPLPDKLARILQAWPRWQVQRPPAFLAWCKPATLTLTAQEIVAIQVEWGRFWVEVLRLDIELMRSNLGIVRNQPL